MPKDFTYPFRYAPHPLCQQAAALVREELKSMNLTEGKMFGVLIVKREATIEGDSDLAFLAAYSGQLNGSYNHPWFVPPIVNYLHPDSWFQQEQTQIKNLNSRIEALQKSEELISLQNDLQQLREKRNRAVATAKQIYEQSRESRKDEAYIRLRQHQKADIQRAKHLFHAEIHDIEVRLAAQETFIETLRSERKQRSEALQQWLFEQFRFLNGQGEEKNLKDIFQGSIPSGAGECCAPKLLQAAFRLGLKPIAMAEFWWGPSPKDIYRREGEYYSACHRKCRPILSFMLQGINVEPDPALHYNNTHEAIRVVWEDENMAVIEKPIGWLSVPGKANQPNVFDEAHRLWPDIEGAVIVHRLDQDTSGLLVIAKTAKAHHDIARQFEMREVHKHYIALLEGTGLPSHGNVNLPLSPDYDDLPRQRVDFTYGAEAITNYEVIGEERWGNQMVTRVALFPLTGRTHQLRVHTSSPSGLGMPIMGDRLYGHVRERLYLHAEAISLRHPLTHELMHFESKCPF